MCDAYRDTGELTRTTALTDCRDTGGYDEGSFSRQENVMSKNTICLWYDKTPRKRRSSTPPRSRTAESVRFTVRQLTIPTASRATCSPLSSP